MLHVFTNSNISRLRLIDMQGKVMHDMHNAHEIDTRDLANGIYILSIETPAGFATKRIHIVH
jgi:hypothetical protein